MKLTQNPCKIRLPRTKSANARSELTPPFPSSTISPVTPSTDFIVTFFADGAPAGGLSLVCIRNEAVRTNWPTAAEKPERKALKGWRNWLLVLGIPA
jgi:hypothetical protein